jgi:hypothetical protein
MSGFLRQRQPTKDARHYGALIRSLPVRIRCGWSPTATLAISRPSSKEITDTLSCSLTEM